MVRHERPSRGNTGRASVVPTVDLVESETRQPDHTPATVAPVSAERPPRGPIAPAERWLAEHGDILWRFALARTRSSEAAEEVVQETILAAMQAFASFTGASTERTWLLGIAANKIADHFRAARRREGRPGPAESPETGEDSPMFTAAGMWSSIPKEWVLDAGSETENAEVLAALRRCIDALPTAQAEAVWLRDVLEIPGVEVCKAMGISPTNLWSRMHRARVALRLCVEKGLGMQKEETP